MRFVNTIAGCCLLTLLLGAMLLPAPLQAAEEISLLTQPEVIDMGTQFNGIDLQVTGVVPEDSEVILRFTGAPTELHLREKGKIFNLLWMNTGTVALKNVPRVCIIDTSQPLEKIGSASYPYSLTGLVNSIEVAEAEGNADIDIPQELLLLKKREGLYSESEQGVSIGREKDGVSHYQATLAIPSALSPGDYHIEAVAIRDGKVVARSEKTITARMVGFPEWLSQMAFQRSLLYGIMATVIALVSGLVIGLVFQTKGAH